MKAYPQTPHDASQEIFRRCGVPPRQRRRIGALDRLTRYRVRTREGTSRDFQINRGFREGCPASPVKLNYYHSASTVDVCKRISEELPDAGITLTMQLKQPFWKRFKGNAEEDKKTSHVINLLLMLFAGDASVVARAKHRDAVERIIISMLAEWGEDAHPGKTERLWAGSSCTPTEAGAPPGQQRLRILAAPPRGQDGATAPLQPPRVVLHGLEGK